MPHLFSPFTNGGEIYGSGDYRALTFALALQPSPPKLASDLVRRLFLASVSLALARPGCILVTGREYNSLGCLAAFSAHTYSGCGVGFGHSDAASLVADFVLGDAGVAARLAVDAVRLLGFGGGAA